MHLSHLLRLDEAWQQFCLCILLFGAQGAVASICRRHLSCRILIAIQAFREHGIGLLWVCWAPGTICMYTRDLRSLQP